MRAAAPLTSKLRVFTAESSEWWSDISLWAKFQLLFVSDVFGKCVVVFFLIVESFCLLLNLQHKC